MALLRASASSNGPGGALDRVARTWSPALLAASGLAFIATILAMAVPYADLPSWGHLVSVLSLAVTYLAVVVCVAVLIDERTHLVRELEALQADAAAERERHARADADHARETELLQRRLIASSKLTAVGELSAAVAHGVNNPLTGVLGYAELLLAEWPADDPRRGDVETIRSEALRARAIVRALVDFSRPRDPEQRETDLRATLVTTIELIRYHLERQGITIFETLGAVAPLQADPAGIQQVVLNVIHNAEQAMPRGGELRVSLRTDRGDAVIAVEDTGHGMDASVAEHAFQPFYTTRDPAASTGLGLSVARGIVESHGGSITLASHPGVGTRVEVRLPLGTPVTAPLELPAAPPELGGPGAPAVAAGAVR